MQRFRLINMSLIEKYAWLLFLCQFFTISCDLVSTRDPESPSGAQTSIEVASSPEEVLDRISKSIILRDPELYLGVIDTSFSYIATQEAFQDNPGFFLDWDYNSESTFIRRLLSHDLLPPQYQAELIFEHISEIEWVDSLLYVESYILNLELDDESVPSQYDGQAELKMSRQHDGGWRIIEWLDEAAGSAETMSKLRATL